MLNFVLRYSVVSDMSIEIGDGNVLGTLFLFYFDQQTGENSKSFRNLKLFDFFC